MSDFLRVNDTILSWNSTRFVWALQPYVGIKSIKAKDAIEANFVWGMKKDGMPLGTPAGKYSVGDVEVVTLRDTADDVTTMLTGLGFGSIGDARFPLMVEFSEPIPSGVGLPVLTTLIETCRVVGIDESQDEGTGELVTIFTIKALRLTRNGKRLWSLVRELGF